MLQEDRTSPDPPSSELGYSSEGTETVMSPKDQRELALMTPIIEFEDEKSPVEYEDEKAEISKVSIHPSFAMPNNLLAQPA